MKLLYSSLLSLFIIVLGCTENQVNTCPVYSFIGPFPKRNIDLTKRLGCELILVSSRTELQKTVGDTAVESIVADSVQYHISFDRKSRYNTITDNNADTLFHGLVSVYKGLFYMSTQITDSIWWISAMDIGYDSVQGFGDQRDQMCLLEEYILNNPACGLQYSTDSTLDIFKLIPDKKAMKQVYTEILLKQLKYKIVNLPGTYYFTDDEGSNQKDISSGSAVSAEEKLIESYYPNPAHEQVQIELSNADNIQVSIIDQLGKIVYLNDQVNQIVEINLSEYHPGIYYIRILDKQQDVVENHELIVY